MAGRMGPADPGTPPDGFSGAPAPGPPLVLGLAAPFGRWSGVHTVFHPAVGPRGVGGRSLVRRGAFADTLAHVAAGRLFVQLLLDHDPGSELASTADGSLRLHPRQDGLYFAVCGPRAVGLGGYRSARPQVSTGTVPAEADLDASDCGTLALVVERRAYLTDVSLVRSGAFRGTWWQEVPS
ncbi:MAG: hypothetical protein C0501_17500 [Isosphaera sp.]|nr:hypothetical protein [Isosphaera sp.]